MVHDVETQDVGLVTTKELFEALKGLRVPKRGVEKPLRMTIDN